MLLLHHPATGREHLDTGTRAAAVSGECGRITMVAAGPAGLVARHSVFANSARIRR